MRDPGALRDANPALTGGDSCDTLSMALRDTVVRCSLIGFEDKGENKMIGTTPSGAEYPAAVSCHFATCYWLITEVTGQEPSLNRMMDVVNSNPTQAVKGMVARGRRLLQPKVPLRVTPGSIVVFMNGAIPDHSCTAIDPIYVMGYNQTGWFANGFKHRVSTHPITQLAWGKSLNANMVERHAKGFFELWTVDEADAVDVMQKKVIAAG